MYVRTYVRVHTYMLSYMHICTYISDTYYSIVLLLTENQTNLALQGVATQTSTDANHGGPKAVIDGTAGVLRTDTCSLTKMEDVPWWQVTFAYSIDVHEVIISIWTIGKCPFVKRFDIANKSILTIKLK